MRAKIVAGNWKMNFTIDEGIQFINELKSLLNKKATYIPDIIIIPPFTHIYEFVKNFNGSLLKFGAQNLYEKEKGAFTGEISANMIKSTGADYVIIGHSERRQYFFETNNQLAVKVQVALKNNLYPIYCCGETLEERNKNVHFDLIKDQIEIGLFQLSEADILKVIIAYEPVWAIGTGVVATADQAQEIHAYIRRLIRNKYGDDISDQISILYGGSVKSSNAAELFMLPDVDGGLVGGASLIPNEFYEIIKAF
jgi:triosephosphate isomerase (TIM)